MIVLQTDNKSRLLEVDSELFSEVKEFIKNLSAKNKKNFSYLDEIGDKVVVINGKEYIVPTKEDLEAIYTADEFMDENEAKKLLGL